MVWLVCAAEGGKGETRGTSEKSETGGRGKRAVSSTGLSCLSGLSCFFVHWTEQTRETR